MIRRILAVSVGVAALAVLAAPTPSEAARKVITAEAHGFNQESVSARAEKRLKRKINLWARWNRLDNVQVGRVKTGCSTTGPVVECKSVALVRG
jgi:hypothetical protein